MSSLELAGGVMRLAGELDHATVGSLRQQAARLLRAESARDVIVDCSGVTRSNSAGLALLLAILRDGAVLDKTISISHLPAEMQQMARVCELAAILQPAS